MSLPELTIAHLLLLIILDDETGKPLVSNSDKVCFALAGATVVALQFSGRLVAVKANRFAIVDEPKRTDGLEWAVQRLGTKPRKLHQVVSKIATGYWGTSIRTALLEDLLAWGIVEKKQDRFFIVSYRTRYPLHKGTEAEAEARRALLRYVTSLDAGTAPTVLDGLLSILRYLKILDKVLGDTSVTQSLIQRRTEMVPIGSDTKKAYEEFVAANIVLIT